MADDANGGRVELGTLATSLDAATGDGNDNFARTSTDDSNPCSVESNFSELHGDRVEVANGERQGGVGKSMWSSSLTSFVDIGSRPSTKHIIRQSTRCILLAAALLVITFGGIIAWRIVATKNMVQEELYAQQDIEIDKFKTLVVGRLSEKLREMYRLALAPSGHSCTFFNEWGALDPDVLQVRAIDTSGHETIRAELAKHHSVNGTITPNWDSCGILQDKSRRKYVVRSLQLPVSSVYISEVDLNMEYGKVEVPYSPVYRVAAPTFASLNNVSSRTGFLIANINASHIWQHVSASLVRDQLAAGLEWDILNTNMHYLASSRPDESILYGHALPERSHITYSGPLRTQIQESLSATADNPTLHTPSVRSGITVSVVLLYSMFSESLQHLQLLGEGGLVLVLSYDENEVWLETATRLTPFFILIPFVYIAALAICGIICVWVQMIKQREEKNQESHRFLAGMSHDLRSPLHVMSSCLHLLHSEELEQKYEFRALEAAVESMLVLLSNTVFIYRSSKDDHVPPQKACLRRVVVSLMEVTSFLANEKDLNIELDIAEDLPEVLLLNWVGLKQILANLLSNGIKFTSSGGISVNIEADPVPESSSVALRISIADTGPGLPGDGQYNSSSSSKDSGGLGLAICSRIVESMGATLQGVSTPGQGCVFTLDNLICPVLEAAKPHPVWKRMAATCKDGYDIVAVVSEADRPRVLPAIVKFVGKLRVTTPANLSIVSGPELADNAAVITPNSVVFIGSHIFHDEKLLTVMSRQLRETGSSAIVLSYVCGSLSHANAMAYVCEEFPSSTYVYPPWMPERIAVQVEAQTARKLDTGNSSSLDKITPAAEAEAALGTGIVSMKEAQYLRVMVVDDMAVNRKIISRILLRKFKVTAKEASGGAECQDLCREGQGFDLVLMDLHMPGMNGIEATQKLREMEQEMELEPALIAGLSASVLERDHANCLECGMDAYYSKPMTPEQLGKVLQQALRRKKQGQAMRRQFTSGGGSCNFILPLDPENGV